MAENLPVPAVPTAPVARADKGGFKRDVPDKAAPDSSEKDAPENKGDQKKDPKELLKEKMRAALKAMGLSDEQIDQMLGKLTEMQGTKGAFFKSGPSADPFATMSLPPEAAMLNPMKSGFSHKGIIMGENSAYIGDNTLVHANGKTYEPGVYKRDEKTGELKKLEGKEAKAEYRALEKAHRDVTKGKRTGQHLQFDNQSGTEGFTNLTDEKLSMWRNNPDGTTDVAHDRAAQIPTNQLTAGTPKHDPDAVPTAHKPQDPKISPIDRKNAVDAEVLPPENDPTGDISKLLPKVNDPTGDISALLPKVNDPTGDISALLPKVNDPTGDLSNIADKFSAPEKYADAAALARGNASNMNGDAKPGYGTPAPEQQKALPPPPAPQKKQQPAQRM